MPPDAWFGQQAVYRISLGNFVSSAAAGPGMTPSAISILPLWCLEIIPVRNALSPAATPPPPPFITSHGPNFWEPSVPPLGPRSLPALTGPLPALLPALLLCLSRSSSAAWRW